MARKVKPIDPDARYLSPRQAAKVLGVSEYSVFKGVADGRIPHRRLGKRILVPIEWTETEHPEGLY
jgi:excisionase family DNA binding protein